MTAPPDDRIMETVSKLFDKRSAISALSVEHRHMCLIETTALMDLAKIGNLLILFF